MSRCPDGERGQEGNNAPEGSIHTNVHSQGREYQGERRVKIFRAEIRFNLHRAARPSFVI